MTRSHQRSNSGSSCDLYSFPQLPFEAVPLTISTDDAAFRDDASLDLPGMLACLKAYKGRSYSACPGIDDWISAFAGADEICVITITSGLSGSYNSAVAAKGIYESEHPGVKIRIFDFLSTGPELRLLMEKIAELSSAGLSFEEVCEKAAEYQKHTRLFFSLHSVHNLAQNGRVSKLAAAAVGVIGLRIIGTASTAGTLETCMKVRGDRKANAELLKLLRSAGCSGKRIRVTHVQNPELGKTVTEMLQEAYPDADIVCYPSGGLCSYYAELGSILIGIETI